MENSTKNKSKIIDSAPGFLKEILPLFHLGFLI